MHGDDTRMVAVRTPLDIGDCAERNHGKAETRIGPSADAITRCADEANANSRERKEWYGSSDFAHSPALPVGEARAEERLDLQNRRLAPGAVFGDV